jgi:predicted aspartyl protease
MSVFRYPYRVPGPGRAAAAFVLLKVAAHQSDEWLPDLPALVDTGADQTVLPGKAIQALGLVPFEFIRVSGFDGVTSERPVYSVRLVVRDLPPTRTQVIGGWADDYAILGRDVLNQYRVVFDGPNQRLEIEG